MRRGRCLKKRQYCSSSVMIGQRMSRAHRQRIQPCSQYQESSVPSGGLGGASTDSRKAMTRDLLKSSILWINSIIRASHEGQQQLSVILPHAPHLLCNNCHKGRRDNNKSFFLILQFRSVHHEHTQLTNLPLIVVNQVQQICCLLNSATKVTFTFTFIHLQSPSVVQPYRSNSHGKCVHNLPFEISKRHCV